MPGSNPHDRVGTQFSVADEASMAAVQDLYAHASPMFQTVRRTINGIFRGMLRFTLPLEEVARSTAEPLALEYRTYTPPDNSPADQLVIYGRIFVDTGIAFLTVELRLPHVDP